MEVEENGNPRLAINDKRVLFAGLSAKVERLFCLNRFPVNLEDFALSLERPDIEAAWRLLKADSHQYTLSPVSQINVLIPNVEKVSVPNDCIKFLLSKYPEEVDSGNIFMDPGSNILELTSDNRFIGRVKEWGRRQVLLEKQILRALTVIKAIVNSCNTVGQYKRVSPELIGFLPSKYQQALGDMIKKSPYPAIEVTPAEIETAMSTLAYAALQPKHFDEERANLGVSSWNRSFYSISRFPRTSEYETKGARVLGL